MVGMLGPVLGHRQPQANDKLPFGPRFDFDFQVKLGLFCVSKLRKMERWTAKDDLPLTSGSTECPREVNSTAVSTGQHEYCGPVQK